MKHSIESIGISNFAQLRHQWRTLSARGSRLHIALGKVIHFGLPKSVTYVPAPTVIEDHQYIGEYQITSTNPQNSHHI